MSNNNEVHAGNAQPISTTLTNAKDSSELGAGLKTRHLTMMGLGSAIGSGLFLGAGVGIKAAGPAILIAYILAGIIVVFVMQMLGELTAARPVSGSFSVYAEQAFGRWAGFSVGWLYWFMLIMVIGAEMTGASAIMSTWFGCDPWIPALVCVVFFTIINLARVGGFGEFEFWFAFIKVAVLIFFLVIGTLLIFGLLPGHEFIGTKNFLSAGFMPHGIAGIATGLLAVAFAFGGIEIIAIAAAESEKPKESIAVAVRSIIWRISLFYMGSVLIITFLMPYSSIQSSGSAAQSPFADILRLAKIPGAAGVMEVVIVLALLSAFNAQIYATSRFVFSLAQRNNAPAFFAKTNKENVPTNAVLLSILFAFLSVGLQYWNPEGLLTFLLNAVGGCLLVLWFFISASYLKLHPELERNNEITTVRMWLYPWLSIFTLVALSALTLLMLSDEGARQQVVAVAIVFGTIVLLSLLSRKNTSAKEA
ncbi:amino acid permease [Corynebacterium sp. sy039]|nr:amino acid permease [Corynebacterium sp. sy039]QDZ42328.1 amino acid permease [Corynebacterium sp. sy039]